MPSAVQPLGHTSNFVAVLHYLTAGYPTHLVGRDAQLSTHLHERRLVMVAGRGVLLVEAAGRLGASRQDDGQIDRVTLGRSRDARAVVLDIRGYPRRSTVPSNHDVTGLVKRRVLTGHPVSVKRRRLGRSGAKQPDQCTAGE